LIISAAKDRKGKNWVNGSRKKGILWSRAKSFRIMTGKMIIIKIKMKSIDFAFWRYLFKKKKDMFLTNFNSDIKKIYPYFSLFRYLPQSEKGIVIDFIGYVQYLPAKSEHLHIRDSLKAVDEAK